MSHTTDAQRYARVQCKHPDRTTGYRRRRIIERLFGAAWLAFLVGGFGLLISYFGGYETYHECRVAMAQEQYRSGHHGEYCYQMWLSGRWDIDTPDDRDIGPLSF